MNEALLLIGLLLIAIGILILLSGMRAGAGARGYGFVLIGPVPILLGGRALRILALLVAILVLTVAFLWIV